MIQSRHPLNQRKIQETEVINALTFRYPGIYNVQSTTVKTSQNIQMNLSLIYRNQEWEVQLQDTKNVIFTSG